MENKEILMRRYNANFDNARKCVDQGNFVEAKQYFKNALEAAIQLVQSTSGNERDRFNANAKMVAGFIEKINAKLQAAESPKKPDAPVKPTTTTEAKAPAAPVKKKSVEEALAQLNNLIGLASVKEQVAKMISVIKNRNVRASRGLSNPVMSFHMAFTGNPGTGKTTVARIMADILCALGILKGGQLVEVKRSDLVAEYVGQTGPKTQAKINEAMGGVLFIDEAYDLAQGGQNDFGKEAINALLVEMENHRDEFVVIVAGYRDPMKNFIGANEGLKSRFSRYIHFDDYTGEELYKIFCSNCMKDSYILAEDAKAIVRQKFDEMYANRDKHFGNGRTARQIYEQTVTKQAERLEPLGGNVSDLELVTILAEDLDFNIPSIED